MVTVDLDEGLSVYKCVAFMEMIFYCIQGEGCVLRIASSFFFQTCQTLTYKMHQEGFAVKYEAAAGMRVSTSKSLPKSPSSSV